MALICGVRVFFFQAEDGIRDLVRSRGLGDVYKRQVFEFRNHACETSATCEIAGGTHSVQICLTTQ